MTAVISAAHQAHDSRRDALLHVLKTLPAQALFYVSILGTFVVLGPDALAAAFPTALLPTLAAVADGLGFNLVANMLERVVRGEPPSDEDIRDIVQKALAAEAPRLDVLLSEDEFQIGLARILKRVNLVGEAVEVGRSDVAVQLATQYTRYETLTIELGAQLRADLQVLIGQMPALRAQIAEILTRLDRQDEAYRAQTARFDEIQAGIEQLPTAVVAAWEQREEGRPRPPAPRMAEALPQDFVPRPEEFERLIGALLAPQRSGSVAITAALRGAGGYGKTWLARAVCHDERMRSAFSDGVLWVTLGERPGDLTDRVNDLVEALTGERPGFASIEPAQARLAEALGERRCLLVVDDAWNAVHLRPFMQGGPACARLITTRNSDALPPDATQIDVDAMRQDEAVALLGQGLPEGETQALRALAARLGEWPLLLRLANGALRENARSWPVGESLAYVNKLLNKRGLTAFDARDPAARDQAVAATLGASLELLDAGERARYGELAVFPEDADVPLATLEKLWRSTGGLDEIDTKQLCARLDGLSLLWRYDRAARTVRLHDGVRAYLVSEQSTQMPALHSRLLVAYGVSRWPDLPREEPYLWRQLAYHLAGAGRQEELEALLRDFDWLECKLAATDILALIADYDMLPSSLQTPAGATGLIAGALRLSAHVLARDKRQLASQILGRLLCFDDPALQPLLAQAREWRGAPVRLVPLTASLAPPGGALVRTLAKHAREVKGVALSADGRRAVSASFDETLIVWDVESGEALRTLRGHTGYVTDVALSADGRRAVSASWDHTLIVWDVDTGAALRRLVGHTHWVDGVGLSADGRQAVSASRDKTLIVWDVESGAALRRLVGHTGPVQGVTLSADGRRAASASQDHTLIVWDVESGAALRRLEGHAEPVQGVALSADGRWAVSASEDKTLIVWDVESGVALRRLRGHTDAVRGVALSADGLLAVSASADHSLIVWDVENGTALRSLHGHTGAVLSAVLGADGQQAISASADHSLIVWDVTSGAAPHTLQGHKGSVEGVALSADGRWAVSASADRTLIVWDVTSGAALRVLKGHKGSVESVALSADGRRAVSASADRTLIVWDVTSGAALRMLRGHTRAVLGVALSADGRQAVSASADRTLIVWDVENGAELHTLQGHSWAVTSVALSVNGRRAVSASWDRTLIVWDVKSEAALCTLVGHLESVRGVALSANGRRAVSASEDHTLIVWDLKSEAVLRTLKAHWGYVLRTLKGHMGPVLGVALSTDGRRAVSASSDGTLVVWDLESGMPLATFSGNGAMVACAIHLTAGRTHVWTIVAGDAAGQVHFLRLEE